jgi:phosphoribosylamine---glycine ligase
MPMRILVVGRGGREHALLWKLAQSSEPVELFAAPGNGGTSTIATNLLATYENPKELLELVRRHKIGLVVVCSEWALSNGLTDLLRDSGVLVFGPSKEAALIETSKLQAHKDMHESDILQPHTEVFFTGELCLSYLNSRDCTYPCVIKGSGLWDGKGVFLCNNSLEATVAVRTLKARTDEIILVQERILGYEVSAHAIAWGNKYVPFPVAKDHKRLYEGNKGPNTGGMGAVAPFDIPIDVDEMINREITAKILSFLVSKERSFAGCIYPGIMIGAKNRAYTLEFNARPGDTETQTYTRILKSNLLPLLLAAATDSPETPAVEWEDGFAVSLTLATGDYGLVEKPKTGDRIYNIREAERRVDDLVVFHAGTREVDGRYYTAGGRVLTLTAKGPSRSAASDKVYAAAEIIKFEGMHYRRDLGMLNFIA